MSRFPRGGAAAGPRATVLLLAWLLVLALAGAYVQSRLVIGTDLRSFLPSPRTAEQRLLLDEIGEGPASRLLLVEISGAPPETLAATSVALAERLRARPEFRLVANGETRTDAIPSTLLPYRWLLTERWDARPLDAARLRAELEARVRDLGSPAGALLEEWIPRDPTLELLYLAERWQPAREPRREHDVWFDRDGRNALLAVETRAPGFDPDGQRAALDALDAAFAEVRSDPGARLVASGPGAFSVLMRERVEREATWIGAIDTVAIVSLLLLAYRRARHVLLGALPLLSAGVAGMAAVSAAYGTVHGITLAFGFTLIGVVQDYPVHLLSHLRPGEPPQATARGLWRTLGTGIVGTCVAYLAFLYSGVVGLAQLAVFTIAGLLVAGLAARWLLPRLVGEVRRDVADERWLARLGAAVDRLPRPPWLAPALALACVAAIVASPTPFWDDELGNLTPVPRVLIERDARLRAALGAPDVRHLVVVEAPDADAALTRVAALAPGLDALVARGALDGWDSAARYLPPRAVQERRRAALPERAALEATLTEALAGQPFVPGTFAPFRDDVERAKALPPLTPAVLADTPLGLRLAGLLLERGGGATALVTVSGARDPAALRALAAAAGEGVTVLDLRTAANGLVAEQRTQIVNALALAALLLVAVVWVALRRPARVARVLLPMATTTLLVVAVLQLAGVSLNLFHLVSLVLAAGLGLDYALFFERAAEDAAEQRRTLHALLVCSAATLIVFTVLAASTLPVLRAIGTTVALGVAANFVLGLLVARAPGVGGAVARPAGSAAAADQTR